MVAIHETAIVEGLTLSGNRGTCPDCGGETLVIDGTFNVHGGALEVLQAPGWTLDRLRQLQDALELARQLAPADAQGAIRAVGDVDDAAANLLRRVLASKELLGLMAVITALAAVATILVTLYLAGQDKITPADVQRIVEETLGRLDAPTTPDQPAAEGERGPEPPSPGKPVL